MNHIIRKTHMPEPKPDDIDARIRRAVDAALADERERNIELLTGIVREMQSRFNTALDRAIGQIASAKDEISTMRNELRALDPNRPDTNGIIRKEWISELN